MKNNGRKVFYAGLAIVMFATVSVRADLTNVSTFSRQIHSLPSALSHQGAKAVRTEVRHSSDLSPLNGLNDLKVDLVQTVPGSAAPKDEKDIKQLPASPDTATLFLSALGSMGIFHAGRSIKKIQFGNVPEWYFSGGPQQIGNTYVLDVNLSLITTPLIALFEQPVTEPTFSLRFLSEDTPRLESQYFLAVEAPRGPPSLS